MAVIDKNYVEELTNTIAKTIIDAIGNLEIEDINMYRIGFDKGIDELAMLVRKHYQVYKTMPSIEMFLDYVDDAKENKNE